MKTYLIKRFKGNWDEIEYLNLDNIQWTDDYGIRASFQIAYDDEKIYVHGKAVEKDIRADIDVIDGQICQDSCLEFFFGPKDDAYYFNIEANLNCRYYVGYGTGRNDRQRIIDEFKLFNGKANKTFDGWCITYEIPFTFINKYSPNLKHVKGYKLKANCYKCGDLTANEHYLTWNNVDNETPDYHLSQYFGEMIFD